MLLPSIIVTNHYSIIISGCFYLPSKFKIHLMAEVVGIEVLHAAPPYVVRVPDFYFFT
jgi:hypothetical protein